VGTRRARAGGDGSEPASLVELRRRGRVAVLELRHPPVNALSSPVRSALRAHLEAVLTDPDVDAVVLAGSGNHFSAGADMRELGAAGAEPSLGALIDRIEEAGKPVVAALHGTVAGGALELALGCHQRVGADDVRLSSPEVTLGFVPGAGATQRLPRLVGLEAALDIILSGRLVAAEEALRLGLLDEVVPRVALLDRAVACAEGAAGRPPRRIRDLAPPPASPSVFARLEADHLRTARGRQAPQAALELVRTTLGLPFAEGLRRENARFRQMVAGPEASALRHVFFAEREAGKVDGVPDAVPSRPAVRAGVVGFGTMGSGIAMVFANAGIPVRVLEPDPAALDRGLAAVRKAYDAARAKGRLSEREAEERLRLVDGVRDYDALAGADVVVEAVFEEMEVKQDVFRRLGAVCRPDALLATNTSSLDVGAIAAAAKGPERVLGLHFFSPAHVMRLVEVVRPPSVASHVLACALQLLRRLGKIGVVVGVGDGFVGNRMLFAYRRQADFLLEEGALPRQVDGALRDFGMAMGPFETGDLAGLDVSWRIRRRQAAARPPELRYSPIADRLCERGRFGQKAGAGWYRYEPGSRTPLPDPEVEALVRSVSEELGIRRREISPDEIRDRCLHALVNEGALVLEEGLAARAGDIDVIWVHGYGFPGHRGGPMYWAETVGRARVAATVRHLHALQGDLVRPARSLRGGPAPAPGTGAW
jgi:3-hydroxyacyl-CoA dehydrogenase